MRPAFAGGMIIHLSMLNAMAYNVQTATVSIGAGAWWGAVYKFLKPYVVAVTGAAMPTVLGRVA